MLADEGDFSPERGRKVVMEMTCLKYVLLPAGVAMRYSWVHTHQLGKKLEDIVDNVRNKAARKTSTCVNSCQMHVSIAVNQAGRKTVPSRRQGWPIARRVLTLMIETQGIG